MEAFMLSRKREYQSIEATAALACRVKLARGRQFSSKRTDSFYGQFADCMKCMPMLRQLLSISTLTRWFCRCAHNEESGTLREKWLR